MKRKRQTDCISCTPTSPESKQSQNWTEVLVPVQQPDPLWRSGPSRCWCPGPGPSSQGDPQRGTELGVQPKPSHTGRTRLPRHHQLGPDAGTGPHPPTSSALHPSDYITLTSDLTSMFADTPLRLSRRRSGQDRLIRSGQFHQSRRLIRRFRCLIGCFVCCTKDR